MIYEKSLFIFDVSAITFMLVLSYLSKRLGEAMKIKPYYKLFYITSLAVFFALVIETFSPSNSFFLSRGYFTMGFRCTGALVAFTVSLRYWKWLFAEFFKN